MTDPIGSPTGEPAPPAPAAPEPGSPPPAVPAAPTAPPATSAAAGPPPSTPIPPAASSAPAYWPSAPGPEGPAPGVFFAGYGARILGYIVDVIIVSVVVGLLSFVGILFSGGNNSGLIFTIMIGFSILVSVLYFPFFWQRDGQTPGMQMFGIRVVRDQDGGPVDWLHAILRFIGYGINSIVFGLPLGWLWVFVDKRRRGWMDLIGGTIVIKA